MESILDSFFKLNETEETYRQHLHTYSVYISYFNNPITREFVHQMGSLNEAVLAADEWANNCRKILEGTIGSGKVSKDMESLISDNSYVFDEYCKELKTYADTVREGRTIFKEDFANCLGTLTSVIFSLKDTIFEHHGYDVLKSEE